MKLKYLALALLATPAHAFFGESGLPPGNLGNLEFDYGHAGRWEVLPGVYANDLESACHLAQFHTRLVDFNAGRPFAACYPHWNGDPNACSHTNIDSFQGVMQQHDGMSQFEKINCYSNTSKQWGSWTRTRNVGKKPADLQNCTKKSRNDPLHTETYNLAPDGGEDIVILFDVGKTHYNYPEFTWYHDDPVPDGEYEFGVHLGLGNPGCQTLNPVTGYYQCTIGFNDDWMYYVDPSLGHSYLPEHEPRFIVYRAFNAISGERISDNGPNCIEFTD